METYKNFKEEWEKTFDTYFCKRCEAIRSVCFHAPTKNLKKFIRSLLQSEREKANEEWRKKIIEIIDWPEPQPGAGEGLGALAGTGIYFQYDADRKKHKEQLEKLLKEMEK